MLRSSYTQRCTIECVTSAAVTQTRVTAPSREPGLVRVSDLRLRHDNVVTVGRDAEHLRVHEGVKCILESISHRAVFVAAVPNAQLFLMARSIVSCLRRSRA